MNLFNNNNKTKQIKTKQNKTKQQQKKKKEEEKEKKKKKKKKNKKQEKKKEICCFLLCHKGARCSSDGSSDRSFMLDPLSYFSFKLVLHDWCNKGRGMFYPVCGMVHTKEPLLLIGKSGTCGGSGFPLSLSE